MMIRARISSFDFDRHEHAKPAQQRAPNKTVKRTRRPDAAVKVCFLIPFGGSAVRPLAARPLPLYMDSSFLQAFFISIALINA
jgi:hypothetical protein